MSSLGLIVHLLTNIRVYKEALVKPGAQRHDIKGMPVGPMSEEHRAIAQKRLEMPAPKAQKKPWNDGSNSGKIAET